MEQHGDQIIVTASKLLERHKEKMAVTPNKLLGFVHHLLHVPLQDGGQPHLATKQPGCRKLRRHLTDTCRQSGGVSQCLPSFLQPGSLGGRLLAQQSNRDVRSELGCRTLWVADVWRQGRR